MYLYCNTLSCLNENKVEQKAGKTQKTKFNNQCETKPNLYPDTTVLANTAISLTDNKT